MPKRPTTKDIDNDAKRAITFNKLRRELFEEAAELSILTGARIAVVIESENGKVYSFGTPSAESVVDNFLSGNPCMDLGGEQNANIVQLQTKVVELESGLVKEKEMANASEKVVDEFPQVQVAPAHTSPVHLGSSAGGQSVGANGGYGHDVGSLGTN